MNTIDMLDYHNMIYINQPEISLVVHGMGRKLVIIR